MNYHVARNGQQLGVFPKEELVHRYNAGGIFPTDLVWTDGMAAWEPAAKVFGLSPYFAQPPRPLAGTPPVLAGVRPGYAAPSGIPPRPKNNLGWAILCTLLCCWPFGIPAIVFAAQVDGKYDRGDYAGAVESARKSRVFMWWSIGLGIGFFVLALALSFVAEAAKHL